MPTNWAGLQARNALIFTLLSSNATRDNQASTGRADVPWPQVLHKVAGRSHSATTGFRGTASAWPWKEAANEGTCRQEEERENFEYTGWGGCSAGETRTQQQSLIALWGRAAGGTVQKWNSSCGQKERWQHHNKVNSKLQEGTLPDFGGGTQMEARAGFWSQSQRRAQGKGATTSAGTSWESAVTWGGALRSSGQNGAIHRVHRGGTSTTFAIGCRWLQL